MISIEYIDKVSLYSTGEFLANNSKKLQQFQIWGISILEMQIGENLSGNSSQNNKIRKVSKQIFQGAEIENRR